MIDQDSNFYLISVSIFITCLLNVWILKGEVTCLSYLGVKGLTMNNFQPFTLTIVILEILANSWLIVD